MEKVDAESSSDFQGSKVLPVWIIRKGMALKQADKGLNHVERQVGIKSKRAEGDNDDTVSEFGGSTRRKMYCPVKRNFVSGSLGRGIAVMAGPSLPSCICLVFLFYNVVYVSLVYCAAERHCSCQRFTSCREALFLSW